MASGEVDQGVVDNDIDAEIPEADAHENYAVRMSDWLTLNALHLGLLTQDQAGPALLNFVQYEADTPCALRYRCGDGASWIHLRDDQAESG